MPFNQSGTLSPIRIWRNPVAQATKIEAIKKPSIVDRHHAYIDSCDSLICGEIINLINKQSLKTYYTLTKEARGHVENISANYPEIKLKLSRDIQIIKVDKTPEFNHMNLSKVNIFIFEDNENKETINNENVDKDLSPESRAITVGTSLGVAINQIDSKIEQQNTSKKNLCISVRDPLATKIYNLMKYTYIHTVDLKFEDVTTCLEHIINLTLGPQTTIQQLGRSISQLKTMSIIFNTNIMYKIFISSFLHTKKFINANWKNKLIIIYILQNMCSLLVDLTDIMPDVIYEIKKPKNKEQLKQIATILLTDVKDLTTTAYNASNNIGNVPIAGHSAMGNRSNLIIVEFISGNISKETKGLQEFSATKPHEDNLQNIIDQIY